MKILDSFTVKQKKMDKNISVVYRKIENDFEGNPQYLIYVFKEKSNILNFTCVSFSIDTELKYLINTAIMQHNHIYKNNKNAHLKLIE